tara:strand:- start:63 stop:272 length:210 start_codon:yes stop_codon:yes gene_type:complete
MQEYKKIFSELVKRSGSGFWDFRTLKLSRYSEIGDRLASHLVTLGFIDSKEDALKHFVPTPKFLEFLEG